MVVTIFLIGVFIGEMTFQTLIKILNFNFNTWQIHQIRKKMYKTKLYLVAATELEPRTTFFVDKHSNILPNCPMTKWLSCVERTYVYGALTASFYYDTYAFRMNLQSVIAWIPRNSLLETGAISEDEVTATGLEPTTT